MNDGVKRSLAYGAAVCLGTALVWGGFFYKADADAMTLVNGAEVRLRLASSMPRKDKQGNDVSARVGLVRQAREELDKAQTLFGETTSIAELRAFALWVEGDCPAAATAYARVQAMHGCAPELRDGMIVNEARMWRAAGSPDRALSALDKQGSYCDEQRLPSEIERMHALADAGQGDKAVVLAKRIALAERQEVGPRLEAGECLQRLRDLDAAERAFELVRKQDHEGTYALARLKLSRGQVDNCLDLLTEFVRADGDKARAKIRSDLHAWQAVAADERFRSITGGAASTPDSGR